MAPLFKPQALNRQRLHMKLFKALPIRLIGLSIFGSNATGSPLLAQVQPSSELPTENDTFYGKEDISEFCETRPMTVQPGVQFNGVAASDVVMRMAPGQYTYHNEGNLIIFSNKHFLLQIATGTNAVTATDGPDLLIPGARILGGCSAEQLSEALTANNIDVDAFERVEGYSDRAYGQSDIDRFCAQTITPLQPGFQYDGIAATPAVMQLSPGRYEYPDGGILLLFPDKHFLLKLPDSNRTIYGTDGDDLLVGQGVGGCSAEQLSEAIANNSLSLDTFVPVRLYN